MAFVRISFCVTPGDRVANFRIMKNFRLFLILILLTPFLTGFSTKKTEWRKIVPMISTREDVEKLLGKPKKEINENLGKNDEAFLAEYELEDGTLGIAYSFGGCSSSSKLVHYASRWTVIEVFFRPDELTFTELKLDLERFKTQVEEGTCVTFTTYTNDEEGILHKVERDEVVFMVIKPTAQYIQFRCDNFLQSNGEKDNR